MSGDKRKVTITCEVDLSEFGGADPSLVAYEAVFDALANLADNITILGLEASRER